MIPSWARQPEIGCLAQHLALFERAPVLGWGNGANPFSLSFSIARHAYHSITYMYGIAYVSHHAVPFDTNNRSLTIKPRCWCWCSDIMPWYRWWCWLCHHDGDANISNHHDGDSSVLSSHRWWWWWSYHSMIPMVMVISRHDGDSDMFQPSWWW